MRSGNGLVLVIALGVCALAVTATAAVCHIDCGERLECGPCVAQENCAWCSTGTCVKYNTSSNSLCSGAECGGSYAHTCPATTTTTTTTTTTAASSSTTATNTSTTSSSSGPAPTTETTSASSTTTSSYTTSSPYIPPPPPPPPMPNCTHHSCRACADDSACSWCTSSHSCMLTSEADCDGCLRAGPTAECETCDAQHTCGACTETDGCEWCGATEQCVYAESTGDLCPDESCQGCKVRHSGGTGYTCPSTPVCGNHTTCADCQADSACGWCTEHFTCVSACSLADKCTEGCLETAESGIACSECEDKSDCGECTASTGCAWCGDSQECLAKNSKTKDFCSAGETCSGCEEWHFNNGGAHCPALGACSLYTECSSCTGQEECEWVVDTDGATSCINSCSGHPKSADCVRSHPAQCDNCTALSDCAECTGSDACEWCGDTLECYFVDISDGTECGPSPECEGSCAVWSGSSSSYYSSSAQTCPSGHDIKYCSDHKTCTDCANDDACGWCVETLTCMEQCVADSCPGGCFETGYDAVCASCEQQDNCADCVAASDYCAWCDGKCYQTDEYSSDQCNGDPLPCSSACIVTGDYGTCPAVASCSNYSTCAECAADAGCGWCSSPARCMEVSDFSSDELCGTCDGCAFHHHNQCPTTACDSHTDCEACTAESQCGWCLDDNTCYTVNTDDSFSVCDGHCNNLVDPNYPTCPSSCQPGHYYDEFSMSCAECNPGHYANVSGLTACVECAKGTHADGYGAGWCPPCKAGHYSANMGASLCQECDYNEYQPKRGQSKCLACVAPMRPNDLHTECLNPPPPPPPYKFTGSSYSTGSSVHSTGSNTGSGSSATTGSSGGSSDKKGLRAFLVIGWIVLCGAGVYYVGRKAYAIEYGAEKLTVDATPILYPTVHNPDEARVQGPYYVAPMEPYRPENQTAPGVYTDTRKYVVF